MKPKIKTRWTEALRSGEYTQGRGKLRSKQDTYCCLGVLFDVIKEEMQLDWDDKDWDVTANDYRYATACGPLPSCSYAISVADEAPYDDRLPPNILQYVGLTTSDQRQLIMLNDGSTHWHTAVGPSRALSFKQIAEHITETL